MTREREYDVRNGKISRKFNQEVDEVLPLCIFCKRRMCGSMTGSEMCEPDIYGKLKFYSPEQIKVLKEDWGEKIGKEIEDFKENNLEINKSKNESIANKLFGDVAKKSEKEFQSIEYSDFSQVMANSIKEMMDVYALLKNSADGIRINDNLEASRLDVLADILKYGADIHLERMSVDFENGKKLGKSEKEILGDIKTEYLWAKVEGKLIKLICKIFGERGLHHDVLKNKVNASGKVNIKL